MQWRNDCDRSLYRRRPHQPTDPGDSPLMINWRPPNSRTFAVFHRHNAVGRTGDRNSAENIALRPFRSINARAFREFFFHTYDLSSCTDVRSYRFTVVKGDSENVFFLPADLYDTYSRFVLCIDKSNTYARKKTILFLRDVKNI